MIGQVKTGHMLNDLGPRRHLLWRKMNALPSASVYRTAAVSPAFLILDGMGFVVMIACLNTGFKARVEPSFFSAATELPASRATAKHSSAVVVSAVIRRFMSFVCIVNSYATNGN